MELIATPEFEHIALNCTLLIYLCANLTWLTVLRQQPPKLYLPLMLMALSMHTAVIALRWVRLEHGPFISLYEILSSNIWSLSLVVLIAYHFISSIRPAFIFSALILQLLMVWLFLTLPHDTHLPPTYATVWLYFHVLSGKVFLGCLLVAVNLSAVILVRTTAIGVRYLVKLPASQQIDELAYRFIAIAFIFESLMLLFGAIWAQDAWGRYWAWDPLETWSFLTWLSIAFILHLRSYAIKSRQQIVAALVLAAFLLAFMTFFGVPFVSSAPHQGMI